MTIESRFLERELRDRVLEGLDPHTARFKQMCGARLTPDEKTLARFGFDAYDVKDMACFFLKRAGIRHDTREPARELLVRALTSSDLAVVLQDSAHQILMAAYRLTPPTFERWTSKSQLPDYKPTNLVRGASSEFTENAEYEDRNYVQTSAWSFPGRLRRFSGFDSVTHEVLLFGLFYEVKKAMARLGFAARQTMLRVAYTNLLANPEAPDGSNFFHADHNNLLLDVSTGLSEDDLRKAIDKLRSQTDPAGNRLNLEPSTLLIPPSLEITAKKLCKQINDEQNPYTRPIFPVVEPLLADSKLTNSSNVNWYLAADPEEAAAWSQLEMAGDPLKINQVLPFDYDLVVWICRLDTNFVPNSYAGMVMAAPGL